MKALSASPRLDKMSTQSRNTLDKSSAEYSDGNASQSTLDQIIDIPEVPRKSLGRPSWNQTTPNENEIAQLPQLLVSLESSSGVEDYLDPAQFYHGLSENGLQIFCNSDSSTDETQNQNKVSVIMDSITRKIDALLNTSQLVFSSRTPSESFCDSILSNISAIPEPLCLRGNTLYCVSAKPKPLRILKTSNRGPTPDPPASPALMHPKRDTTTVLNFEKTTLTDITEESILHISAMPAPLCLNNNKSKASNKAAVRCHIQNEQYDKENMAPLEAEQTQQARRQADLRWAEWTLGAHNSGSFFGQCAYPKKATKRTDLGEAYPFSNQEFSIYVDDEHLKLSAPKEANDGLMTHCLHLMSAKESSTGLELCPVDNAPVLPSRNPLLDHSLIFSHNESSMSTTSFQEALSETVRGTPRASEPHETPCPQRQIDIDSLVYEIAQPSHENVYGEDGVLVEESNEAEHSVAHFADLDDQLQYGRVYPSQVLLWPIHHPSETGDPTGDVDGPYNFAVPCEPDAYPPSQPRLPEISRCDDLRSLRERFDLL
ncbi:hypothetical protein CkaCkLH20_07340 [Colletotrichum karsti]|uniref:Uncharacterized protein n=1 Tax=Colletotrichum karsti TaxID=1095194 RepID=A0A9P6I2J7_9PEZI|nr:uncharacterized protein CkaCkLH20_07340 [Colletotrichum karsti]KAF9875074.1 hypothetical protein CkaCkLH20_07340 [Colletotrichum karsti]